MAEVSIQPNRDNLFTFLDFAGEKGLMKKATAGAYKRASSIVLRILDEAEANDLSKTDLDSIFLRHRNKAAGRIAPQTLKTYEARTRAAVDSFVEYIKDPSSWKSRIQPRTRRTTTSVQPVTEPKGRTAASGTKDGEVREETSPHPPVHIDVQIHISPEATPEQIDQIFSSMRRNLYGSRTYN